MDEVGWSLVMYSLVLFLLHLSIDKTHTNLQIHKSVACVFKEPRRHKWIKLDFRELYLSHLSKQEQEQVFDHMWMKLAGRYQRRDHPAKIYIIKFVSL